MKDKLRVLVTGGTGFVGSAIVEALHNAGNFKQYIVARNVSKIPLEKKVDTTLFVEADLTDYETLYKLEKLEKIDILIHAAGLAHQFGKTSKDDFWQTNVTGTENVCRLSDKLKIRHLILISSVSVYGNHGDLEIDETFLCRPKGFYAESKLESERRSVILCEEFGINLTILRLATVIGEGDIGNVARLIRLIDKNLFFWVGKGSNKKSLIDKKDVARVILGLIEVKKNIGTEIYNLTSEAISLKEIVKAISLNLDKRPLPLKIPEKIVRGIFQINKKTFSNEVLGKIEKTFEKWLSNDVFSGKNLLENYGLQAVTPISEAVKKQVIFYLEQKRSKSELK